MHARWSTYIEKLCYKPVHKSRQQNRVIDALSRRMTLMRTLSLEIVSFETLTELYAGNVNFKKFGLLVCLNNLVIIFIYMMGFS